MDAPFLSVIMPVYNAEKYLYDAVRGLLSQTFADMEIICVNDCSQDSSLEILHRLENEDERVIVIDSPENVGAGGARNLGLTRARGRYITFMDSDDSVEPDLYERAVALCGDGSIDEVVWGLVEEHYDKNGRHLRSVPIVPPKALCQGAAVAAKIVELERDTLFGYQWNALYRGDIVRENGIRFEHSLFYEDYFFNLEFARHIKNIATLDYAGYHYFKRVNGSITNSFTKDYFALSYRRVDSMRSFLEEGGALIDSARTVLANILLRYTFSAVSRNCDKRSEMTRRDRKAFLEKLYGDPLYTALIPYAAPQGILFKVMLKAFCRRWTGLSLLIGRIIYICR